MRHMLHVTTDGAANLTSWCSVDRAPGGWYRQLHTHAVARQQQSYCKSISCHHIMHASKRQRPPCPSPATKTKTAHETSRHARKAALPPKERHSRLQLVCAAPAFVAARDWTRDLPLASRAAMNDDSLGRHGSAQCWLRRCRRANKPSHPDTTNPTRWYIS